MGINAVVSVLLPALLKILEETPALVHEVKQAWSLLTSNTTPTDEEQKAIDDALAASYEKLQASG